MRAPIHRPSHWRPPNQQRKNAAARGYDARWRKARLAFLRRHPLCAACEKQGRVVAALVVDHKIPHRGDERLFWDQSNWQPLCKDCHDRKTAMEDGGFGRPIKPPPAS